MNAEAAVLVTAAALLAACGAAGAGEVAGIVIDTDRSVNCATLKTIVADVCKDAKTDQDKAIAIYNFMVRTCWMSWHSHRPLEIQYSGRHKGKLLFANDPMKYISVYGYLGCGPQAGVLGSLMEAAGIESRNLNPGFGHVSCEFKWGGKWHWLDPWLPAYVLDKTGEIASYEQIMADRDLFMKAKEEGRSPGNFMVNWRADKNTVKNAKGWKAGSRDPYPQRYVEDLKLRPGESCTWLWGNVGKWYNPSGPYVGSHLIHQLPSGPCMKFGNDAVLKDAFPYWEPYKKTIKNGAHSWSDTYYRYYGNAIFVTAPPLTPDGMAGVGAKLNKVRVLAGGGLSLHRTAGGEVDIGFEPAYVVTDTVVEGEAEMGTYSGISVCFSTDGGKTWLLGGEVTQSGKFSIGIGKPNTYEFPAGSTSGRYQYVLRLVFRCGYRQKPTVLKSLKVTNTTMLNFYSRPWLEPGDNNVTVTAAKGEALAETPLEVTWKWVEDWKSKDPAEKSFTHKVDKSGAKAVVKVAGEGRPKMTSVTIACPAK